jgi:hypothetical protein
MFAIKMNAKCRTFFPDFYFSLVHFFLTFVFVDEVLQVVVVKSIRGLEVYRRAILTAASFPWTMIPPHLGK